MTISSIIRKQSFSCNGSLTEFDFDFTANSAGDIKALIRSAAGVETILTVTAQYSATLNPDGSGGTLTTVATWATGNTLVVYRETDHTQETEYKNNRALDQEVLMSDLDKVMMIVQETDETWSRALRFPMSDPADSFEIPKVTDRAGNMLGFDADGKPACEISVASVQGSLSVLAGAESARDDAQTARDQAQAAQVAAEAAKVGAEASEAAVAANAATAAAAASAASASETAAGLSEVAAELAKTNAETAETAAELAQSASESARDGSVTAKNAAVVAQGLAEAAKDAAVIAQTAAELAETHAETAETNAEAAQTGAEIYAAASAASAVQAAASAAETSHDVDGGKADSVYSIGQSIDGGGA